MALITAFIKKCFRLPFRARQNEEKTTFLYACVHARALLMEGRYTHALSWLLEQSEVLEMTVNEKSIIDGLIREIHDQIPTAEYEESEENKGTTALKQGSDQQNAPNRNGNNRDAAFIGGNAHDLSQVPRSDFRHSNNRSVQLSSMSFDSIAERIEELIHEYDEEDTNDREEEDEDTDEESIYLDDYEENDISNEESTISTVPNISSPDVNNDGLDSYQQSLRARELDGHYQDEEETNVSQDQLTALQQGGTFHWQANFYPDLITDQDDLKHLLADNPEKYKRCLLHIESSHKAVAKVLDSHSKFAEILISGRSKCGRSYYDDEVVVEVLAEPDQGPAVQSSMKPLLDATYDAHERVAHGRVVGLLKRTRYPGVDNPVLVCTLDEIEGHLMKPLCKTVPKIHVMNESVRKKYKALSKYRVEVKRISAQGKVEFKKFQDIEPDKRELYVFKVIILAWSARAVYPLGAVLDVKFSGMNYPDGLSVLHMQQGVPNKFSPDVVDDTKTLLHGGSANRGGRRDLTARQVFTIDPPSSQDLDDALSVWEDGSHLVVGVHIADVAAVVREGTPVDIEARKRAVTFYPAQQPPRPMFPEPLSHGVCSLLPNENRLTISVFFKFDRKLCKTAEPWVEKTVIRSKRKFTYEEIQKVIDENAPEDIEQSLCDDICQLHKIADNLRYGRLERSKLFIPFEDPRLPDLDTYRNTIEAHALVEEFMVLANTYMAERLKVKFPGLMILRCHRTPTYEQLSEWREKEGSIGNLVVQLQGRNVSPETKVSVENIDCENPTPAQYKPVIVQSALWQRLCEALESHNSEEARTIAYMDSLHPLQCLANQHWLNMMDSAEYKCSYGLNQLEHFHFGLNLQCYTHFTSPIRRYADLHVHRLLHADLDGKKPKCTPEEVMQLCQEVNSAMSRQKAFQRGCHALQIALRLHSQPLVFRAYVDCVDIEQVTLCVPSILAITDRKQELPFSVLGVSSQPELITDTMHKTDTVHVVWSTRVYNERGVCTNEFTLLRNALERQNGINKMSPLTFDINPHQLSELVKQVDWAKILKALIQNIPLTPTPLPLERGKSEVVSISTEKGDGSISSRPCRFRMSFSQGQVIVVQMTSEPNKGILRPRVELVQIARNVSMCVRHAKDPVSALARYATKSTRDQRFQGYNDYLSAWMPLLEMEAACGIGDTDSTVVVENVLVLIRQQKSKDRLFYSGTFTLSSKFCSERYIDFGGKSPSSIKEEEASKGSASCPLDYLCIRCISMCNSVTLSQVQQCAVGEVLDKHYIWVGHAGIVAVKHKQGINGNGCLVVEFVLNHNTSPPPQKLMIKGGRATIEILPKSEVERRAQQMLMEIKKDGCELAQAIAFSKTIPRLDVNHLDLGRKNENHEVEKEIIQKPPPRNGVRRVLGLPKNNPKQFEAIVTALTNSLSLIQGPPGTGKTYTGIKLVYLFSKINRQLGSEGKGKKVVLYCGPSNKSVDLVAKLLRQRLGPHCPNIVRIYGSAIEASDYPIPQSRLLSSRRARDLKSDPELKDLSLHHIIRMDGRPYAEELLIFDAYFQKCCMYPDQNRPSSEKLRIYRRLKYKASVEELSHYEVILCTCSVGGSRRLIEGTKNTIFQVIIDECAMSCEPHSLVPIIATKAKQVVLIGDHKQLRPIIKCQQAAELGLDQSLFERLYSSLPKTMRVFLNTQYRMHPMLCEFPSQQFYEGNLLTGSSHLWRVPELPFWPSNLQWVFPHILVDVRGIEETLTVSTDEGNERSKSNLREAEKVVQICTYLKKEYGEQSVFAKKENVIKSKSIKVLTQYNAQRHLLEEKLKQLCTTNNNLFHPDDIDVSTVVSSQGGEWDYIILSTVRSLPSYKIEPWPTLGWCRQNLGFITDKNQVNVALTRARRGLIIVGNVELLRCDEVWCQMIQRYEKNGCIRVEADFPPPVSRHSRRRQRHQHQV